ncbi:MAG: hypothetical protein LRY73_01900 [Bacillus sp. (in: Bacteria)]|nr:hypothetical protein [Bacillus sp. (in: firmicutes)]
MLKHLLRGSAIGIFIATSAFASTYFFSGNPSESYANEPLTLDEAVLLLEEADMVILNQNEYNELVRAIDNLKEELYAKEVVLETVETELDETQEDTAEQETETDVEEEPQQETVIKAVLVIEGGMSTRDISNQLINLNIIEDRTAFENYVNESGLERSLRFGEYELASDMTIQEIARIISSP